MNKNDLWSNYYETAYDFGFNVSNIKKIENNLSNYQTKDNFQERKHVMDGYFFSFILKHIPIILYQHKYYVKALNMIKTIQIKKLKDYAKWCVFYSCMSFVASDYWMSTKHRKLGTTKPPLWRFVMEILHIQIPYNLSTVFSLLPTNNNIEVIYCIAEKVRQALLMEIPNITWLSNTHKRQYSQKIRDIQIVVGTPEVVTTIKQYESFARGILETKRQFKISQTKWKTDYFFGDSPSYKASAVYQIRRNAITISCGFLCEPFIGSEMSTYAGVFMILCHEFCHSIDPTSIYYFNGQKQQTFSKYERQKMTKLKNKIISLYSKFISKKESKINLDDNFADLGALHLTVKAFMSDKLRTREDMQNFFKHLAITRRSTMRKKFAHFYQTTDAHAPHPVRLDASLSINNNFHEAFDIRNWKMFQKPWNVFSI